MGLNFNKKDTLTHLRLFRQGSLGLRRRPMPNNYLGDDTHSQRGQYAFLVSFLVSNAHSHFLAIVRPDGHSNAGLDTGTRCENTPKQAFFLVLNVKCLGSK